MSPAATTMSADGPPSGSGSVALGDARGHGPTTDHLAGAATRQTRHQGRRRADHSAGPCCPPPTEEPTP